MGKGGHIVRVKEVKCGGCGQLMSTPDFATYRCMNIDCEHCLKCWEISIVMQQVESTPLTERIPGVFCG
jgi:hypothetical protein